MSYIREVFPKLNIYMLHKRGIFLSEESLPVSCKFSDHLRVGFQQKAHCLTASILYKSVFDGQDLIYLSDK